MGLPGSDFLFIWGGVDVLWWLALEEGDEVKAGDPIIRVDLPFIREHAKDIITPIIISDESDVKSIEKRLNIVKTQDMIMEVN